MELSAYVRDKDTGEETVIVRDYPSKVKFAKDLKMNGYSVIRISNKRDLAAQNFGYESYTKMKKDYDLKFGYNRDFYKHKFEELALIGSIPVKKYLETVGKLDK
ncbi:hypothetical protein M3_0073 [Lysinibacillus phage vB_LfM_LysYB1]|nr:hypothetical protein M3_0073 [Lysinibacillus phage vB_LfM_LysYB1]WAB25184.1 hypothetical protein M5_0006 [Lysinibacillus phage vB_LfM_LysYB2]